MGFIPARFFLHPLIPQFLISEHNYGKWYKNGSKQTTKFLQKTHLGGNIDSQLARILNDDTRLEDLTLLGPIIKDVKK